MPRKSPRRRARARLFLFTLVSAATLVGWQAALAHFAGRTAPDVPDDGGVHPLAEFVREVPLRVGDVVYNPGDKLLYVSVPSSAGATGNSVVAIDPATGQASGVPTFVGSEPTFLTLADDNRTLYAYLDGAYAVRRFDTQTRAAGQQFALGRDASGSPYRAADLAVAPGSPNLLAVVRAPLSHSLLSEVAVYDDGVPRAKTLSGSGVPSTHIAFSASQSKLYVGGDAWLRTVTVDASGLTAAASTAFTVGPRIKFANGRIYSSRGQAVDPETGALSGTFSGVNTPAFEIDAANGRAYYLSRESYSGSMTLRAFDLNTFVQLGSATISASAPGYLTTLVRWGSNGLAARTTEGGLILIQTSLVPSSDPVPSPTPPTPTPTATPTPVPPATFVRQLDLPANDLVYNPATQALYASVHSSAGARGNSVTRIAPETGEIGPSTFVGSEPGRLALADDNQTMYVGLRGANAIRRLDVSSLTAGLQFHLGLGSSNGVPILFFPGDIEVMPGRPGTVAVSRTSLGGYTTDILIYDDGVARPQGASSGSPFTTIGMHVEFGASPDRLYAGSNPLTKLAVGPGGLTKLDSIHVAPAGDTISSGRGATHFAGGLLYYSDGLVVDPETGEVKGRLGDPALGNVMTVDEPNGRAYIFDRGGGGLHDSVMLHAYDIRTFRRLAQVEIRGPNMANNPPSSLVRWGKNGLAFHTRDRIFLINSALVDAAEPVASPTPPPSPTPTPTPPYVATHVTRLELTANDLVYDPSTQTLHASVPSAAGAERGNTITSIDPASATVNASTFIGSEPSRLALSPEGGVLYAYLNGAKAVRRFDTLTRTAGVQFAVGPETPWDMDVVPGSPDALAVSLGGSPNTSGVAVFDNGVRRPNVGGAANSIGAIAFASPSTLYGTSTYENGFLVKMELTQSGLSTVSALRGLFTNLLMEYAAGRVYSGGGRVHDAETGQLIGSFAPGSLNGSGGRFVIDTGLNRAFFLGGTSSGAVITAYDLSTFLPVGAIDIPHYKAGTSGQPASLVRWGTNGLAFTMLKSYTGQPNAPNDIYIVRTALVSDAETIPSALQLGAATYTASESTSVDNSVTITVRRTGGVSAPSTVSYATADGTAAAGSDYTAVSGTLTFAPNELTKTFAVPVLDDNVFEGSETFNVSLSSPAGASLLSPSAAVVTINDNEFQPSLNALAATAVEGDSGTTAAEMIVRLSNLTSKTVTVNYATADGTARAGEDYVAASGTLTFQPGELEKKIALQIIGDAAEEASEYFSVNFNNAINVSFFQGGTVTILDDDRPTVQFTAASVSFGEGAGRATATVTRFGPAAAAARVDYITLDDTRAVRCDDNVNSRGSAFARCDYATTIDTLAFAPGERQKTISVPLVDDGHDEPDEFVRVQLFNASGVTLGTQFSMDVRIVDNDAPGAPNPLDSHAFFVRQHYLDFLSREPESDEPWTAVLLRCPNAFNGSPNDPSAKCDRNHVSSSFFRSREFELKGYFVYRFYRATLGRRPRYTEFTFDTRRVTGADSAEVLAKRRAFSESWLLRQEVAGLYGTLTNAQFVSALLGRYGLDSIRSPDPAAPDGDARVVLTRAELTAALDAQHLTRAQVLRAFVESSEVDAAEFNGAFVTMQYLGYLRRDPDLAGYNAWLAVLNRGEGFRAMINGFMNSPEYRLRFGKE